MCEHDSRNCPYCKEAERKLVDILGVLGFIIMIALLAVAKYFGVW